jgi:CheY-like chemotaxis protein
MANSNAALVVHDSSSLRSFLRAVLRENLCFEQVLEVGRADEALALLTDNPHIRWIFSGWELPGMTGRELAAAVRGAAGTADVNFIMVTSRDEVTARSIAANEGLTDYLTMPLSPGALVRKVRRLMGLDERRRAIRVRPAGECEIDLGFDEFQRYAAKLLNISCSGCLLRTTQFVQGAGFIYDIGTLTIPLTADVTISVRGRIVRVEQDESRGTLSRNILVAFEFEEMDAATHHVLDDYIETRLHDGNGQSGQE